MTDRPTWWHCSRMWWRDSLNRRRVVLGFYAALLLAVAGAVLGLVVSVISSQSASFSDRLVESGDWLAGGTLALATIAGLVALQAYASATGLPRLLVNVWIESPNDSLVGDESTLQDIGVPRNVKGPFTLCVAVKNESGYSARNPSIVLHLVGTAFMWLTADVGEADLGEGWSIIEGSYGGINGLQWDGGPTYSIHGYSVRQLRCQAGNHINFQTNTPFVRVEMLAEGYRREVEVPLSMPRSIFTGRERVIGWVTQHRTPEKWT